MYFIDVKDLYLDDKTIHYLTPKDLRKINTIINESYLLNNIIDGEYYFIQLKNKHLIRSKMKSFFSKTIFFLPKIGITTAHYFLARFILQINFPEKMLFSAGELSIYENKILQWNLKSGGFWAVLELTCPNKAKQVELPMSKYIAIDKSHYHKSHFLQHKNT
jgi:hypothetical protein